LKGGLKKEFNISEIKINLKEFIPYMCKNDDLDSSVLSIQSHEGRNEERKATVMSKGGLLLAD
jgi:hypothetical protein